MTRRARIALISSGSVILVLAIAVATGVVMVQSGWLLEKIRARVVAEAEKATGGKVEIGALRLDWKTLTAELDNLVIHGTEPANTAPLLTVKRVAIGFRVISLMERDFDVARVEAQDPAAHVILEADGSTNLPRPKMPNGKNAVRKPFWLSGLAISIWPMATSRSSGEGRAKQTTPWNARGGNLAAHVTYDRSGPRYNGTISLAPIDFDWNGGVRVSAQVAATASMENDQLTVSTATVKSAQSQLDLRNVLVSSFTSAVITGEYSARVSLAEADRIFRLVNFQHTGFVNVSGNLRFVSAADYLVTGAARGTGIGYGPVRDMRISGNISATPDKVLVNALIVNALGGEMRGAGEVRKLEDFHISGTLDHFDARMLAGLGGVTNLPYNGILSGPFDAAGKLQEPGFHRIKAGGPLAVSPAADSLPVQGQLTAKYDGETSIAGTRALLARTSAHTHRRDGRAGAAARSPASIARFERSFACSQSAPIARTTSPRRLCFFQRNGSRPIGQPQDCRARRNTECNL